MILKELNLVNFGKFSQEKIEFKEGLNVIYGENESGKSTIHNFIDGMFYGFLKPNVTRRYYFDEYEKYRPWNGKPYTGVLRFSKDHKIYRIDRNFQDGEVSVYEDLTGKNITKDIDTGHKIKLHLPGIHFFDFNTTVYRNTISIKQLENKIDSSLSKEVKDRLANMTTSLDDEISVKEAILKLDNKLENIGTERAYTRPYGRAIENLQGLENQKEDLLKTQEIYNDYIDESVILKKDVKEIENNIEELEGKLGKAKLLDKKQIYEEGLKLRDEIKEIDKEIVKNKDYSDLSFNDYTKAIELEGDINHLKRTIEELREHKSNIEIKLAQIGKEDDSKTAAGIDVDVLSQDYSNYDKLEAEKNNEIINTNENRLEMLYSQRKTVVEKEGQYKILGIASLVLTLFSLALALINIILPLFAIPLGGLAFYFRAKRKQYKEELKELNLNVKELEYKENTRVEKIAFIEEKQEKILLKYNCPSIFELKRLYDNSYMDTIDKRNKRNKINELKKQGRENIRSLEEKEKEKLELIDKVRLLIDNNKSENLKEFKENLDKKRKYEDFIKDRENKIQVLEKVLGENDLESLKSELMDYDMEFLEEIKDEDKAELEKQLDMEKDKLSNINKEDARLEERINNLNADVKKIVEVEEEIFKIENLLKDFERKIESIKLAKNTIEGISENIHHEFAPIINKNISEIMNSVTNGRYDKIRIDDNLNISVENPKTEEIIDLDSLSGGTIDQLYFALRFSIIASIKGDNLPLILDDCFMQYDESRLENILKILSKTSMGKQILLFTCHHREKKILDDLGIEYNLINLT